MCPFSERYLNYFVSTLSSFLKLPQQSCFKSLYPEKAVFWKDNLSMRIKLTARFPIRSRKGIADFSGDEVEGDGV